MAQRILVVDDEEGIVLLLKDYFELQGEALARISCDPDMIILDINMPDLDGLSVCRKIREKVSCPILFLTARVEEQDRITGFIMGGDDYIVKPFSIEELGARVMAHLRREERVRHTGAVRRAGDLTIYYQERSVLCGTQPIDLTRTEYDILSLLSLHPGQVFSKERIYESVRGYDASFSARSGSMKASGDMMLPATVRSLRSMSGGSGTRSQSIRIRK